MASNKSAPSAKSSLPSEVEPRALLACEQAKQLEEAGEYAAATEALGDLWLGVGRWPELEDFTRLTSAALLLRVGCLTGWIGSREDAEVQDKAKDLISAAFDIFDESGEPILASEAESALGICYWRQGAHNEARVRLQCAIERIENPANETRLSALLNLAMVERSSGNYIEALRIHRRVRAAINASSNPALIARFHNGSGLIWKNRGRSKRAFREFDLCRFYLEKAGHTRFLARLENNLGLLCLKAERYEEGHSHLDHADLLFEALDDDDGKSIVDDSRAQLFIEQGEFEKAEAAARRSADQFEHSGSYADAVNSMAIGARALARQRRFAEALELYKRAYANATQYVTGDLSARIAILMFEELSEAIYVPAGLPFKEEVKRFEAKLIVEALEKSDGSPTAAALRLGLSQQTLSDMLNEGRHKDLISKRNEIKPRGRSIIVVKDRARQSKAPVTRLEDVRKKRPSN